MRVDGWRRAEEAGLPEAMIFVHGYNTNDVQSMQIMAQMAAFGNFPSYIKPFLFTWPAGENFLEFFDARENAKNPLLHAAFTDFLRSLRDNGTVSLPSDLCCIHPVRSLQTSTSIWAAAAVGVVNRQTRTFTADIYIYIYIYTCIRV